MTTTTTMMMIQCHFTTVLPNLFWPVAQHRTLTLSPIMHEQQCFSTEMPIYFGCTPN